MQDTWGLSVPTSQFSRESETFLRSRVYFKARALTTLLQTNREHMGGSLSRRRQTTPIGIIDFTVFPPRNSPLRVSSLKHVPKSQKVLWTSVIEIEQIVVKQNRQARGDCDGVLGENITL